MSCFSCSTCSGSSCCPPFYCRRILFHVHYDGVLCLCPIAAVVLVRPVCRFFFDYYLQPVSVCSVLLFALLVEGLLPLCRNADCFVRSVFLPSLSAQCVPFCVCFQTEPADCCGPLLRPPAGCAALPLGRFVFRAYLVALAGSFLVLSLLLGPIYRFGAPVVTLSVGSCCPVVLGMFLC